MIKKVLPNGVTVILREDLRSPLLTVQAWVGAGSLDEDDDEKGMAHLLEHMLFKGTDQRAVGEIARTIERCGGGINAYTTFDRTVFYLTVAKEHAQTGSEVLADAIFNSSFDKDELEREKEVVVEEIRRSLDNPAARVGRKIFSHCYAGCEAARPIIGSEESVRGFNRDKVVAFHQRWYQPSNICVVAVGNFDGEELFEIIARDFGAAACSSPRPARKPVSYQFPARGVTEIIKADYKQPRLEVVFPAPGLEETDSVYLDLAAFALGSGDSSRLTRRLRDELQFVSAIGASVYSPNFGGIFSISVYPLLEHYEDCIEEIGRVFGEFKYQRSASPDELAKARANLKADYCYQQETIDGLAKSMGFGLTTKFGEYFEDVYMGMVEKADTGAVNAAVSRWLDESRAVIIGMVPETHELDEQRLRARLEKGIAACKASKKRTLYSHALPGPIVEDLSEGIKFVYRQIPTAKFVSVVAVTEGGLRAETEGNAGIHHIIGQLLGKQSSTIPYSDFLDQVDGMGATIDGFSGKDSFGLRMHCLPEQWQDILRFFAASLKEPEFPTEQWQSTINEIGEQIKSQEDTPSSVAFRTFQEIIFAGHPYRFPVYGYNESVTNMSPSGVLAHLGNERDGGPWVIGVVGPLPKERVQGDLEDILAWWRPNPKPRALAVQSAAGQPGARTEKIKKNREQAHIIAGIKGLTWDDPDRATCDVLSMILGGQGGRLFYELRDKQSLAYTVSAISNHGRDPGIFAGYLATAPDKAEHATAALIEQMMAVAETPPLAEEVDRAVNVLIGNHSEDLQHTNSQALTMALMELYNIGASDFLNYPKRLKMVDPQAVQRVARRLFNRDHLVVVQVG